MALVAGHDVHLVALDFARELRIGLSPDDTLLQQGRHPLDVVRVEVEFLGDLLVREVQPEKVEDQNPGPKRLVVADEDRVGRVIKPASAGRALVAAALRLGIVLALLDHPGRIAAQRGERTPSGQRRRRTIS